MENYSLNLLIPPPEQRLNFWLREIYGKNVEIKHRKLLRHRDLSYVERIVLKDAIPESIIYKVVLPPWDVEQDLHEHILIPSVSNSARLYLASTYGRNTALFLEDLGPNSLLDCLHIQDLATITGTEIAKLHRAYTYRITEIEQFKVLKKLLPSEYPEFIEKLIEILLAWNLLANEHISMLENLGNKISKNLKDEPISLVHGDLYAENILYNNDRLYLIDWSWFTNIGASILDLATLSMDHLKNGNLFKQSEILIEAYCTEYSRNQLDVSQRIKYAESFTRILFLDWLVERRKRGIMGTTLGPVDIIISTTLNELKMRNDKLE